MKTHATVSLIALGLLLACGPAPEPGPSATAITHGPILGRLDSTQVGVWARTSRPGEFRVFYGLQPDQLNQAAGPVETRLEDDNTGWVLIEGLQPGTKYYYEASAGDEPAGMERLRGHFHTLPTAGQFRDAEHNPDGLFNFRFEFACGNNQNTGGGSPFGESLPTYQTMLAELVREQQPSQVDFAILNGDWLYEEEREYTPEQWRQQVGISEEQTPKTVRVMPAIAGVWENYKLYLSRARPLADWHRYIPSFFTFDDHEIVNDVYGSGEVGRRDRRAVFRDIGVSAWYDYLAWSNPVPETQDIVFGRAQLEAGSDVLTDSEAGFGQLNLDEAATLHVHWGTPDAGVMLGPDDKEGGDPNSRVYEIVEVLDANRLRIRPAAEATGESSYSIGRRSYFRKRVSNAELLFVDTRSYRLMHDTSQPNDPTRSMLGQRQKQWLKDEMRASDADFFFVISSVNFMIPHIGGTGGANIPTENKDDAWTTFLAERQELIEFWDSLGKPVFVLTGDLHNSFAIKVTGRVWEFASGPHNSSNHPASSEGGRPPNGMFAYQGHEAEIRWSTYIAPDTPNPLRARPVYTVVQISNVFRNPKEEGVERWVAYPHPQATFQYFDGLTGELLYAESIVSGL